MVYQIEKIKNIKSLLNMLKISESSLNEILANKDNYYKLKVIKKKDGADRNTYAIKYSLKKILQTINKELFCKVKYSSYLHGSLRGKNIVTNAGSHSGATTFVQMDIKSFFPSIKEKHVFDLFHLRFQFPKSVSKKLANIIIYKGEIPQGSPVSSYVANLILEGEDKLAKVFLNKGYCYTRYVDDIVVSSSHKLSGEEIYEIKRDITMMIERNGFQVNKKKTEVTHKEQTSIITGLRPGLNSPKIPDKYVRDVLTQIKDMEQNGVIDIAKINSVRGKINHVKRFSKSKGKYLEMQLVKVKFSLLTQGLLPLMKKNS